MNKTTLIRKLSSRKLWAAVVGVVVGAAAAFGIDTGEYAEIAGIVTSAVSVVAYIFAESRVDAANTPAAAPAQAQITEPVPSAAPEKENACAE